MTKKTDFVLIDDQKPCDCGHCTECYARKQKAEAKPDMAELGAKLSTLLGSVAAQRAISAIKTTVADAPDGATTAAATAVAIGTVTWGLLSMARQMDKVTPGFEELVTDAFNAHAEKEGHKMEKTGDLLKQLRDVMRGAS
jgi:hypothetical protein